MSAAEKDPVTKAVDATLAARNILTIVDLVLAGWYGPTSEVDDETFAYALSDTCAAAHAKLDAVLECLDELESARVMEKVEPQAAPLACGGQS